MTDQPTPRAPEPAQAWQEGWDAAYTMARWWGHVDHWDDGYENPYAQQHRETLPDGTPVADYMEAIAAKREAREPTPEPSAPDDLQNEIAAALFPVIHSEAARALAAGEDTSWDQTYIRAAAAVMDVLRREGLA